MFDWKLFEKVNEVRGGYWTGGVDKHLIDSFSKKLNTVFPESYIEFIERFGEGGVGFYIFGIKHGDYSSAYNETINFRKKYKINEKWIVIAMESNDWEEYALCLDTSRMKDGECPVVKYDYEHSEVDENYKENFYDLFNYKCEVALNARYI